VYTYHQTSTDHDNHFLYAHFYNSLTKLHMVRNVGLPLTRFMQVALHSTFEEPLSQKS